MTSLAITYSAKNYIPDSQPGYSFVYESSSGYERVSPSEHALVVRGNKRLRITPTQVISSSDNIDANYIQCTEGLTTDTKLDIETPVAVCSNLQATGDFNLTGELKSTSAQLSDAESINAESQFLETDSKFESKVYIVDDFNIKAGSDGRASFLLNTTYPMSTGVPLRVNFDEILEGSDFKANGTGDTFQYLPTDARTYLFTFTSYWGTALGAPESSHWMEISPDGSTGWGQRRYLHADQYRSGGFTFIDSSSEIIRLEAGRYFRFFAYTGNTASVGLDYSQSNAGHPDRQVSRVLISRLS
jgi:hypothetical protein